MQKNRIVRRSKWTILAFFIFTGFAHAQVDKTRTYINQQRFLEEQIRLRFSEELPLTQKVMFDWGGWYSLNFIITDDGYNSSRILRRHDFRLWGSLNIDGGVHTGFVRMKMICNDFNPGDSYDGNEDDFEGPNLDRGWYRLDFTKAMLRYGNVALPFGLAVKIGRAYSMIGTGFTLSTPMDGVWIEGKVGDFDINALFAKLIHSYRDLDSSRPNYTNTRRYFYGIEVKYRGFENHQPFFYYLWQRDKMHDSNPDMYIVSWDYDSEYLGFGSKGQLVPYVKYSAEVVYERGKTYGFPDITDPYQYINARYHRDRISAWGWDVLIEYFPPVKTNPRFSFEYIFASGDPDRIYHPTNTFIGNQAWTKDLSFNAFGYRNTGLVLFPDMTNIHIWRLGASFFPFDKHSADWLKRMELGTDWFLYHKHRSKAAISDDLANVQSGYVGWEMDYFVNWRMTSDFAWTIRYGAFFPGKAYTDKTTRTFFLAGFVWSF